MLTLLFKLFILGSIAVPITIVVFHLSIHKEKLVIAGLIWTIGIGPAVAEVFGPHIPDASVFDGDPFYTPAYVPPSAYQTLANQLITYNVLYFILLGLLIFIFSNRSAYPLKNKGGRLLLVGVLFLSAGPVLSGIFGAKPSFTYSLFILPMVFAVVSIIPRVKLSWICKQIKFVLLVYIYGSLLILIINPSWASLPYSGTWIPGINFRLMGISSHPNALGPLAGLFFFFELLLPSKDKKIQIINFVLSLLVLILAQSKTAWLSLALGIIPYILYRLKANNRHQLWKYSIALIMFAVISFLVVTSMGTIIEILNSKPGFSTLTGRLVIWEISLKEFEKNPLFGYGPKLWDLDFRTNLGAGFLWIGQSHNQFVQSISESGLIGIAGLVIYLAFFLITCFKTMRVTSAISLSFFLFMLVRSMSETPLRNYVIDNTFFIHFSIFLILLYTVSLKQEMVEKRASNVQPVHQEQALRSFSG